MQKFYLILLILILFLNSISSFQCIGEIDPNAIICKDSNLNLDQNYPISLIESNLDCNNKKKCEWSCEKGYYLDNEKCLALSELTCEGSIPQNATICPNDNINITQKGITNILVNSKDNCSEIRKCQWYCNKNYYIGGVDANECLPFVCTGNDFENALIYYNDAAGLNSNIIKELVDANTSRKCEYYCKQHYHIEVVEGVRKCISNIYSCVGEFENATLFEGDKEELEYNLTSILSKTNTSRKCEWSCNEGYFISQGKCALKIEETKCGGANKYYSLGEEFPGSEELCINSISSIKKPILGNSVGATITWKCIGDANINCKAMRIGVQASSPDYNSIIELIPNQIDEKTILISLKCSNPMKVNISVFGEINQKKYELDKNQFDCNDSLNSYELKINDIAFQENNLVIKTSIKETTLNCVNCEKETIISLGKKESWSTIDPLLIGGLIGFILLILIFMNLIFNLGKED